MTLKRAHRFFGIVGLLATFSCGGADGGAATEASRATGCTPGEAIACACSDGTASSQTCDSTGASFGACACVGGPIAPALPTGTGGATGGAGGAPFGGGASAGGASPTDAPTGGAPAAGGLGAVGGAPGEPPPSGGAGGAAVPVGPPEGIPSQASCTGMTLGPVTDYGAMGPFGAVMIEGTGPDGQYTMFRPEVLGGTNGFLHPPITWGNGIYTTPVNYIGLLETIASHGFVIIASNSSNVNAALMRAGLDWLLAQNDSAGELQGMLATSCAATVGYSLGGGASIDAGSHPAVVTTVSFHGLQGAAEALHGPLFLLTSTNDGFVTKQQFTVPTYGRSSVVPTLMATLEVPGAVPDNFGHLIPTNDAGEERAPAVAWLRHWVLGDEAARSWFFGDACVLCQTPWVDIQRKNGAW